MNKINAWLYHNHLKTGAKSFFARLHPKGFVDNQSIAKSVANDGGGLSKEIVLSILNHADRLRTEALLDGFRVHTDFVNTYLTVSGDTEKVSNNSGEFTLKVRSNPTAVLQKKLKNTRLHIRGLASTGPIITMVEDVCTRSVNGLISPGQVMCIYGECIKIAGDTEQNGIFFISKGEQSYQSKQIVLNERKKLIVMVPELAAGFYRIELRSQFNPGSRSLKAPISVRFNKPLEVLAR